MRRKWEVLISFRLRNKTTLHHHQQNTNKTRNYLETHTPSHFQFQPPKYYLNPKKQRFSSSIPRRDTAVISSTKVKRYVRTAQFVSWIRGHPVSGCRRRTRRRGRNLRLSWLVYFGMMLKTCVTIWKRFKRSATTLHSLAAVSYQPNSSFSTW